jgi:hypothetical protein
MPSPASFSPMRPMVHVEPLPVPRMQVSVMIEYFCFHL